MTVSAPATRRVSAASSERSPSTRSASTPASEGSGDQRRTSRRIFQPRRGSGRERGCGPTKPGGAGDATSLPTARRPRRGRLRPLRSWARRGRRDSWPWARGDACPTRSSAGRASAAPGRRRNRPPPSRAPRRHVARQRLARLLARHARQHRDHDPLAVAGIDGEGRRIAALHDALASIAHSMSCGQTLRPLTMIRSLARPVMTIWPSSGSRDRRCRASRRRTAPARLLRLAEIARHQAGSATKMRPTCAVGQHLAVLVPRTSSRWSGRTWPHRTKRRARRRLARRPARAPASARRRRRSCRCAGPVPSGQKVSARVASAMP